MKDIPGQDLKSHASTVEQLLRRAFLRNGSLGGIAAASLLGHMPAAKGEEQQKEPHFEPKAKRVIYLFQSGGPSQLELLDYKPKLKDLHGTELPDSIRNGQRLTGMTSGQKSFPVVAPKFSFQQAGSNGGWYSELLPHTAGIADDLCVVR
ncbi:MAG: hypothetical protein RL069_635, partial [Planctomycetota bacterium]